ncbi:MAG: MarR family winged helix-turn-helix transcriptional regulator [Balneola sp.]
MNNSIFDPDQQQEDISSKIVAGMERLSEVFKVLLWDKAKQIGLSPIQIQIMLFIAFHKRELCSVSHLAKEFNVTKPTVSDAIKVLIKKEFIEKDFSSPDSRSYYVLLTDSGKDLIGGIADFADPLKQQVDSFDQEELEDLFSVISELIYKLNRGKILTVQRTCYGCRYYQKNKKIDYCTLLQKNLLSRDIRLDCPEFEEKLTA